MSPQAVLLRLTSAWLNSLFLVAPDRAARQTFALFCTPRRRNAPAAPERAVLEAAETRRLPLPEAGVEVALYRWPAPAPERAPRVLLAHGWESCAGRLAAWVEPLRSAGFEVLGVDAPAHGASAGHRLTALDYVEAMTQAAAHSGGLHAVIGHSFGGLCAALATGGMAGQEALALQRLVLIAAPENVGTLMARFGGMLGLREPLLAGVARRVEALAGRPMQDFSAAASLAARDLPVLIVHDSRDEEVPCADGERLAARLPGAELYVTTGLGHRQVARNPHVIRYAIDFLRRAP